MFCTPGLVFCGTEGVGSHFHVLRSRTRFRRYRGRPIPFSCLSLPNMFLGVLRASVPFFLFCAPGLVFGGTEGVRSRFYVFRSRTCFWGCRGRRVPFSRFALQDSFSAVPRVSRSDFMFCPPGFVFGGTEGVRSRFYVFPPGHVSGGIGSLFHVLRSRTRLRRYQGRRVPFSCFARPGSFLSVLRASGPIFMLCGPRLVFGGTEDVGSRFQVLYSQTRFRWCRVHRVPFSSFARPKSFSAVSWASGPVCMFCSPGLVFGGTEGVGSCFHVLRSGTHFRQ
jgi:hypothetical protein